MTYYICNWKNDIYRTILDKSSLWITFFINWLINFLFICWNLNILISSYTNSEFSQHALKHMCVLKYTFELWIFYLWETDRVLNGVKNIYYLGENGFTFN